MKIFYDTEFLEDGQTIDLISIGLVAEDGREYYAISRGADWDRIVANEWLMNNVVCHLPEVLDEFALDYKPREQIRDEVRDFILASGPDVELWADYAAYDHVAFCQLFGRMIDLPDGFPMWTHDFQQVYEAAGCPDLPQQKAGLHNALADARHLKVQFDALAEKVA